MIVRHIGAAIATVFLAATGAHAQVIEIDDSGRATTFDQPAVFDGVAATPIRARSMASDPRALLADAAKAHGLDPALLTALAWQESRGRMAAISPRGAMGVMQLMPGTAAELGVRADDLGDNIRGGALYLRRQLDRFGSVPLALAAYNAGPGAVLRYRGIPPYRETQNYVATIMAHWRPTAALAVPALSTTEVVAP